MKIEKINENKIKITLTIEELNERKISIDDIASNEDEAKKLFIDLIEESYLDETFVLDHAELFVEATTDNKNFFSVTITKLNEKKDITKFTKPIKTITKNIFFFNNIENLTSFLKVLDLNSYFIGKNSLYKSNDKYCVIFSKSSVKNIKFLKTYYLLCEYSLNNSFSDILESSIKEKYKLILKDKAIQILVKD